MAREDAAALKESREHPTDELRPVGELERLLVDWIIAAYWRLRRLGRVEAGIFAWELYGELRERAQSEAESYKEGTLEDLVKHQFTNVTDEQKRHGVLSKAQEMKIKQDAETATLDRTFIRDAREANARSKLSRYEASLYRSLYKALHELQRLQAARRAVGNASTACGDRRGSLGRF